MLRWTGLLGLAAAGSFCSLAAAQTLHEPVWRDSGLQFPEGSAIPRFETEAERLLGEIRPPGDSGRALSPPPTGPIHCVAEYEPMQGILIAWEGDATWLAILAQMAARITNQGDANLYVVLDTSGEQSSASSTLSSYGTNLSRVQFGVRTTDTIWCRDYGPRYVYEGNVRAVVDHTYNRNRPSDNALNAWWAGTFKHHPLYDVGLIHGGGNYHLDALGSSFCTRLVVNENPTLTETQIHDRWESHQNLDTTFFDPFPTSVDSTQHIDMWMQVIADDKIVISDWPTASGSTQDNICDNAAATLISRGYTVYRVPAVRSGGVHYTFTNVVMCNGIVMIPSYTNSTASQYNDDALSLYQSALPDKQIFQIPSQNIVTAAGVLHCIVMHVPQPLGGVNPTAYLRNLRGGDVLTPGAQVVINWSSDDDVAVSNVDLLLSTNGGTSYDTVIASQTADDGAFTWTVPSLDTAQARVRVLARDAQGHTGYDESDSNFTIGDPADCPGDLDGNGVIDLTDLSGLLTAFGTCSGNAGYNPDADLDASGCIDLTDLSELLTVFGTSCP